MSLPIASVIKNAAGGWVFTWLSTGASFYRVVLWGILLSKQTTLTFTYNGQDFRTFPPPLEVVAEDTEALSEKFSPLFLVQWYGQANTLQYVVQQYNTGSGLWDTVATIKDNGSAVYSYRSPVQADQTTIQFRVFAENRVGLVSASQLYQKLIVCPPKPTDSTVQIGYTGSQISVLPL